MNPRIDLSVLICSTDTRWDTFGWDIQEQVWGQYNSLSPEDQARVEVIIVTDNKRIVLGDKRNLMVAAAQGRYVQFIDDDDLLHPRMLEKVLAATDSDADVVTFLADVTINGGPSKVCRYSIKFDEDRNTSTRYERLPNHICAVKRELAQQVPFPSVLCGEDSDYSKRLAPLLDSEFHIPEVLYHYVFNDSTTETQVRRRRHASRVVSRSKAGSGALVDVVIMSNSRNIKLQKMTQETIDSCIAGANMLPVNVTVMEQWPGVQYGNAETISAPKDFNYHGFANIAARRGSAPWIMVANNDLRFHSGWLEELLAAKHDVVSPRCPRDRRQADLVGNESGFVVGRHLSGWCYMLRRELFDRLGGVSEEFPFWCADDAFVEQLRRAGVEPMVVPGAVVEHLRSVTLNSPESKQVYGDLTWANIHRFVAKYGGHPLQNHPAYRRWLGKQIDRPAV